MLTERVERAIDLTLGSILLVALLPLLAACALSVLLCSGRPVLFRQRRIGKGGIPFEILKFRSMVPGTHRRAWPHEQADGPGLRRRLRRQDPRVTSVGRLLRRWALDELPQLANVVRGDMSLVGPRPVPPADYSRLQAQGVHKVLTGLRPGVTGPYQVALRRGFGFDDARRIELVYAARRTIADYLRILVSTPYALARGGGDLLRLPSQAGGTAQPSDKPMITRGAPHPIEAIDPLATLRDIHRFRLRDRAFIFDPMIVRAFCIDEAAWRVLSRVQRGDSLARSRGLSDPEREALRELTGLATWMTNARQVLRRPAGAIEKPGECRLMLDITQDCTLRCAYCYCADPRRASCGPQEMSWEVAAAAVDLLAELASAFECPGFLNFSGGEPLLCFDLLKQLVSYSASVADREKVELKCSFGITNGTVHPPGLIDFLKGTGHVISVSLDGTSQLHDVNRRFADSRGSHEKAVGFAGQLIDAGVAKSAGATVAANNCRPKEMLEFLADLGFRRVVIKPARLAKGHSLALDEENVRALIDGYDKLTEFLLDTACSGNTKYLLATLNDQDFFGRFLLRTLHAIRVFHRCPAGRSSFAVSTTGELYPCSSFTNIPEFVIGHVADGIDWEKCRMFLAPAVDQKGECAHCWARHLCGGGCAYSAYLANGSVLEPDQTKCQLIRHLCLLSFWLWAELAERRPDVAAAIRTHTGEALRPFRLDARVETR